MVSREQLKRGGLRAYETGRARMAARAAWVLLPTVLVCALSTGKGETCACFGVLLLGASVFLRWRDRRGAELVRHGLTAGALPLFVGLVTARLIPSCVGAPLISACTAVCLCIGLPSGIWLGRRLAGRSAPAWAWIAAMGIAVLAASLGCVGLGIAGLTGTIFGLLLGALSVQALSRVAA